VLQQIPKGHASSVGSVVFSLYRFSSLSTWRVGLLFGSGGGLIREGARTSLNLNHGVGVLRSPPQVELEIEFLPKD
jgi:hypothetical protein